MVKPLGLKLVFVHYFPDDVHGLLLAREKRILLNARKPRYELRFTVLHEIGHFFNHVLNPYRQRHLRILDWNWRFRPLTNFCSFNRRYTRMLFAKGSAKEWEADLWAFCAFLRLARFPHFRRDLLHFLGRRHDKIATFCLALLCTIYSAGKCRLQKALSVLKDVCR